MTFDYDVIAIGGGSAGLGVAISMRRLGLKTALIERNDHRIGGDCLNDGCVPSKALIHVARQVHAARQSARFGLTIGEVIDVKRVMDYVRERQNIIRAHENAPYLGQTEGVDVLLGEARFAGFRELVVRAADGSERTVSAKNIVMCTGSQPQRLIVPGVENVAVHTHQTIFHLTSLPPRWLVVGAGPIGIEMAQAFRRLGSQVTVVGRDARILPKERAEASALLHTRLREEGIEFRLNSEVVAFTDAHVALIRRADEEVSPVDFDAVLVATGRSFDYGRMNLDAAGVRLDEAGRLKLNAYLQTTNPHVWAAGDAAAGAGGETRYFSHAAELHMSLLMTNLLSPLKAKLSYDHFSWVTFTDPEVATFGLNEQALQHRKLNYERLAYDFARDDRAVVEGYDYARMWLLVTPAGLNPFGQQLLGGTIVAPGAGELVQELILACQQGLSAGAFFNKIYPYPTASRANKNVWVDAISTRLPNLIKKAVRWWY